MCRLSRRGSVTWLIKLYPVWRFSNVGLQWQGGLKRVWSRIKWALGERIQISPLRTRIFVHEFINPNNITKCCTSPTEILGQVPSADFALRYANSKNLIEVAPRIIDGTVNINFWSKSVNHTGLITSTPDELTDKWVWAFSCVLTDCKVAHLKAVY